jgi:hypothetical protein
VHEGRVVIQHLDDGDRAATERRPSGQRGNPQRGPAREPPAGASEETPSGGALRFLRPDGRSFDSVVAPEHTRPLYDAEALRAVHDQQGIVIDKKTATTRWRGEKMDYGLGIEVLLQHAKRRPRVSAETC